MAIFSTSISSLDKDHLKEKGGKLKNNASVIIMNFINKGKPSDKKDKKNQFIFNVPDMFLSTIDKYRASHKLSRAELLKQAIEYDRGSVNGN